MVNRTGINWMDDDDKRDTNDKGVAPVENATKSQEGSAIPTESDSEQITDKSSLGSNEMRSEIEDTVNITPGVGVYAMFRSFNYRPWLALGELLDNSISSYQKHRERLRELHGENFKLRLMVDFNPVLNTLTVKDNAGGIDKDHFGAAFALATPPDDLRFIGRYGVGMKAAACWFAREWSVRTSAIGEGIERTLNWDTKTIVEGSGNSLKPESKSVGVDEHYTVITLRNLIHPPSAASTIAKIKTYLPNIYREFLREEEIEILWNGEMLQLETPAILVAPPQWDLEQPEREWQESVELVMSDGRKVKGRVFLLKKMKRKYTALNLFWHSRLILGNVGENHRPSELFGAGNSFETGRLCVELFMDEYEPTVDKMGFKFQDDEATLEEIIDVLKREAAVMLRQAREYREPKIDPDEKIPDFGPIISTPGGAIINKPAPPTVETPYPAPKMPLPTIPAKARELTKFTLPVDGLDWEIVVLLGDGPGENKLVNIEEAVAKDDDDPQRLYITLGMAHPFILQYWSDDRELQKLMVIFASAIGFGEISARRAGAVFPSYVRNNIDEFLKLVALGNSASDK